ncbi:MAG: DUF3656 domain-containing U32 family peptidase [Anaerovoracaceae bacterium]|jgi:putative protease
MIRIPELLAPVGGQKQLVAAIENGADAVYLGGRLFSARQYAENFNDDELKRALEYVHIRGANAYIALNTLISDSEMQEALEYANRVYEAGADALIVQDIGFATAVRRQLPDLHLHLSTQATVYNAEGVKVAEGLGARRVVLARELSLEEIREIAKGTSLELEMFVHGALCQCYSGQCYLSSMIGGRSGNRGTCAQPCRLLYSIEKEKLPYTVEKKTGRITEATSKKGYYLSPKDLCTIEHLHEIVSSGVRSLKIEGRMKSPEYVAIVTAIYRKYLDMYAETGRSVALDPKDLKDLMQIYNRGGFSTGYIFSNPGRNLITKDRAKHWGTYLGKVTGRNERKKYVDIRLEDTLSLGDGIEIVSEGLPGNVVTRMLKKGQKAERGEKGQVVTVGYIDGEVRIGDPVYKISDKELNKEAEKTFSGGFRKRVPLIGHLVVSAGEPLHFTLADRDGNRVDVTGEYVPEPAVNRPLSAETARAQIEKTGSTPFYIENCTFEIGENLSVPLSEINAIRRKAIDDMIEIRGNRYLKRKAAPVRLETTVDSGAAPEAGAEATSPAAPVLSVYLYEWKNKDELGDIGADRIYLPVPPSFNNEHARIIQSMKEKGIQVYLSAPPVTRGEADSRLKEQAKELKGSGVDGLLIGNLGHLELLAEADLPMVGDYSLNIYNSQSVRAAAGLGFTGVTLSHELTLSQMKEIHSFGIELEATVYGRVPVMISEHCPIGSQLSRSPDGRRCGLCKRGRYFLKDRTGAEFPVIGDPESCRSTILNKDKLRVPEYVGALLDSGVGLFRLYFYEEDPNEMREIMEIFRQANIR